MMKNFTEKQSYGILLFSSEPKDQRKYLLIQNRDSEAFIYFFLSWNMNRWTDQYFSKVLKGFSKDEINRLLFYPFELIYTDLYVNHQKGTFQKQYDRAKANYEYFHSRKDWIHMSMNIPTTEIKWGFPKGRIEPGEHPFECAIRELKEETDICLKGEIRQNNFPAVHYMNEKSLFKTMVSVTLFPVQIEKPFVVRHKHFPNTIRCMSISNEVLHARWVDIQEASLFLSPHLYRLLYEFHLRS